MSDLAMMHQSSIPHGKSVYTINPDHLPENIWLCWDLLTAAQIAAI
jgi:hypothetical protein